MEIDIENQIDTMEITKTEYPDYLYISGFPFTQQGWNSYLTKSYQFSLNGAPIYYMKPYYLYGLIPIKPLKLIRQQSTWVLSTYDCFEDTVIGVHNNEHFCMGVRSNIANTQPIGDYKCYGFEITICKTKHSWF